MELHRPQLIDRRLASVVNMFLANYSIAKRHEIPKILVFFLTSQQVSPNPRPVLLPCETSCLSRSGQVGIIGEPPLDDNDESTNHLHHTLPLVGDSGLDDRVKVIGEGSFESRRRDDRKKVTTARQ